MNTRIACLILCSGILLPSSLLAKEPNLRLKRLTTKQGDSYHQVELLKADAAGAFIRHSRGIARVRFQDMPKAIQKKFQTAAKPAPEKIQKAKPVKPDPVRPKQNGWIIIQRYLPPVAPACNLRQVRQQLPYPHWLAVHPCRKLAELDFLYVTGILRRPPNVRITRLWSTRLY